VDQVAITRRREKVQQGSTVNLVQSKKHVELERKQKDHFLASDPQSPLLQEERGTFEGLAYWPPDPAYRFEIELHEHNEKELISVVDTGGQERDL